MLLEAKGLRKIYQMGEAEAKAVNDVSFQFEEGIFYAIIGKSGSGKSTLIHMLSGMDKPSEGEIIFRGKNISTFNDKQISELKRKRFGFIFQSYNLLPELCAEENILLPLYLDNRKVDKAFLEQLLGTLDIKKIRKKYPVQLSGGEQQRVAIARALINQPQILFADEPTGNLDSENSEEVVRLFIKIRQEWKPTIILVTHDRDIAKKADVVIELQDGKIAKLRVRRSDCVERDSKKMHKK